MKRFFVFLFLGLTLLLGCRPSEDTLLRGRILLWHEWGPEETAVLDEMLAGFHALHPQVRVVMVAVPPGMLRQRYEETAGLGLGPDLLILSDADVRPLADANLIRPIPDSVINIEKFLPTALNSLVYREEQYGLPLSLQPLALFYNAEQVASPARTLQGLLQEARAGHAVALNAEFLLSLWGLPAFGGSLFSEDGRVLLDQGGYTNWLNWLKAAQDAPGMILDRSDEVLRDLFIARRVAYYVGSPQALPVLREQMRGVPISAAPLPAGPLGPAGPLLQVEALLFNQASSPRQAKLAFALAEFLTNAEQSAQLMRETDRIPANRRVRVDQQTFPVIAGFTAQARTAVAVPQLPQMDLLAVAGEDSLRGVLAGLIDVNEAAVQLTQTVNGQLELETDSAEVNVACDASGTLTVWHSWRGKTAASLDQLAADYMALCPNVSIELRQFEPDTLPAELLEISEELPRPDLMIGPSTWTEELVQAEMIGPLSGQFNVDRLQQFVAAALDTLRADGQLFGLPLKLNLSALFYNGNLVTDPAKTVDDLLTEAALGKRAALPLGFEHAYWGAAAFGSTVLAGSNRPALVDVGFVAWLAWLQQAQSQPGIVMSGDDAILQALFSSGSVAYYAGPAHRLDALQTALGEETVRVTPLPAGPNGAAAPHLSTDAVFFHRAALQVNSELALDFALYLTAAEAQTRLMNEAHIVPANINVNSADFPAVAGFLAQAQTAVVWPDLPQQTAVLQQGNQLYESVVLRQSPPAPAACNFAAAVYEAGGISMNEAMLPEFCQLEIDAETNE